jgi:hypothetical protein
MTTDSGGDIRAPRLNPFAFPSDTSIRFVLLIVFVICSSLSLYGALWWVFHSDSDQFSSAMNTWFDKFGILSLSNTQQMLDLARHAQPFWHDLAIWKISGAVLTLSLAIAIYWLMPTGKIWWEGLQPVSFDQDLLDMSAYLECLCLEARLSRIPTFMCNPSELLSVNQIAGAQHFGRLGRYYIYLNGGLIYKFFTDPLAFRAWVLHELAHFRNADANKTRFTLALGVSFALIAVLPSTVSLLWHSIHSEESHHIIWFSISSILLVWLTFPAVLRIREFYADVRASVWDGPSVLIRVLKALQPNQRRPWHGMKFHPEPYERQQTLKDTDRLLRLGFWDAFGAGFAAVLIVKNVQFLFMGLFFTPELAQQPLYLWGFLTVVALGIPLFFISLSVGVVGIGIWRGAFVALMRGQAPRDARRLGFALALGLLIGELLRFVPLTLIKSDYTIFELIKIFAKAIGTLINLDSTTYILPTAVGLIILSSLLVLLFAMIFVIFKWVAAAASIWLEVVLYRRSPNLALTTSLVIASGFITVWVTGILMLIVLVIIYLFLRMLSLPEITSLSNLFSYLIVPSGSVIYATLFGLWTFPLAASLWRTKATSKAKSTWAFLEEASELPPLSTQPPLRPGLALIIGLVSGLIFCALLISVRYTDFMGPWLDSLIPSVDILYTLIGFSAFMQAIAAAIAASWIIRLGVLHGLTSASIAGYIISLTFILVFEAYRIWWFFVIATLSTGTLLALPMTMGSATLAGWIRSIRSQG